MYREHDNTHLMHSLERQFFRFVIRQIDYERTVIGENSMIVGMRMPIEEMINIFCKRKEKDPKIKRKQLLYYVKKWGFIFLTQDRKYEYDCMVLEFIPTQYLELIPARVKSKLYKLNIKVEKDGIYYETKRNKRIRTNYL